METSHPIFTPVLPDYAHNEEFIGKFAMAAHCDSDYQPSIQPCSHAEPQDGSQHVCTRAAEEQTSQLPEQALHHRGPQEDDRQGQREKAETEHSKTPPLSHSHTHQHSPMYHNITVYIELST